MMLVLPSHTWVHLARHVLTHLWPQGYKLLKLCTELPRNVVLLITSRPDDPGAPDF